MARPFRKGWKYLMAFFEHRLDEYADPKILLQQAVAEDQRQHQALTQQAASVIGNQRKLELELMRKTHEAQNTQTSIRKALELSDKARTKGDEEEAVKYEETAQMFAINLVALEDNVADLKNLHTSASKAAEQAKQAVNSNAAILRKKLAERSALLTQLEQAKMQEQVAASLQSLTDLTTDRTEPTLAHVRDKIERRYSNAVGATELANDSIEGRMLKVQEQTLSIAGSDRLEEIRASMKKEINK